MGLFTCSNVCCQNDQELEIQQAEINVVKDKNKRTPEGNFKRLDTFDNYTDGLPEEEDYDYDKLPFQKVIDLPDNV